MNVDLVLQVLSDHKLIKLNKVIGDWYSVYCPFHSDGHERNPSCGVSRVRQVRNGSVFEEGVFHCFSCGIVKSMTETVKYLLEKNASSKSAVEWLSENVPGFEIDDVEFEYLLPRALVQTLNNKYALDYISAKNNKQKVYIDESELQNYRFTVDYMYQRKLTDAVIEKFDVGVDLNFSVSGISKKIPCITFPVRDKDGNVLFIYRRSIEGKNFYMPKGLEKPIYGIYELPKGTKSVILCESILNALTCYVYGYPALALFGTGTKTQIQQLKLLGMSEFILGLDPDEAGDRGSSKLKNSLKSVAIVRKMDIPQGKDINDLTKSEFVTSLESRL